MSRIAEIETRLSAIKAELDNPESNLQELSKEVNALMEERQALIDAGEKRKALLESIKNGEGTVIASLKEEKNMSEQRTFAIDSVEYRNAYLKNLQGKELNAEERAAIVASAAIPTQTMNQIIHKLEESPLIKAIDLSYIPSNIAFPVESAVADASWIAMSTASTDSTATLTEITLGAYKLIKTVEVDADVKAMAIDAFEAWLVSRLANKIMKAVDNAILNGSGTSQPTGLATTLSSATGTFTKAAMTFKDLMKIIAALPGVYSNNASFVMPRALFYGDVLGMQTTAGERIVVADAQSPAKFNILGYPVILDDNCAADNIYFGDLKAYKFNFAKAPTVELDNSVGFRIGSTCYRAMALADGKLSDSSAIVRYTRASA